MKLRLAKKVHLGRSCAPGPASRCRGRKGCHKWSTISQAERLLDRATRRGTRLATGYAAGGALMLTAQAERLLDRATRRGTRLATGYAAGGALMLTGQRIWLVE